MHAWFTAVPAIAAFVALMMRRVSVEARALAAEEE